MSKVAYSGPVHPWDPKQDSLIIMFFLKDPDCPDPHMQSPYTGLSGSSCRVPRLDTAPTCCPDPHMQS